MYFVTGATTFEEVALAQQLQFLRLTNLMHVIRAVDPHMAIQHVLALLVIARKPGCSPGDLMTELETSSASAARIVARLSTWETPTIKGYGLIEVEMDMADRRRRLLWLTPAGQKLVCKMEEALQ